MSGSRAGPYGPPSPLRAVRCRFSRIRLNASIIGQRIRGRPRGPSGTAPAVDEDAGHLAGGGVAAHHGIGIAALLKVGNEDRLQAAHRPVWDTLENQLFSTNPSDEMVY